MGGGGGEEERKNKEKEGGDIERRESSRAKTMNVKGKNNEKILCVLTCTCECERLYSTTNLYGTFKKIK